MNCVNKSSKEFKSLAAKHNVSDNTLELIVHKYWKETGSEELFPSDSYIQAQLGAIPYEEPVIVARELWQKEYSGVSTYNTFDDLQKAMTEASKYFPAEAIVYYKNADGKYSLLIKKPVVKLGKALEDIQKKGYLEARKESIGTEDNKEYSVNKAKELFNKFNADRTSLPLADKIFKLADTIGIKVVFSNDLKDGNMGAFGHNTIILNKDFYENSNSNDKKAATILHELIHAITTYAISDKVNAESLSKPLQEFRKDIHQLFTELQYNHVLKGERGVLNEREFIAELSNPIFRQKIQAIDNNRKESFWQRVVNAIKKLLGIHSSSPYYTRMMNTLDKAINAFDVKTYMEYNGLNNALKQDATKNDLDYNNFIKNQKELDDIKAQAIKNGTFMKAPNGKPTNLTEQQWLQVRTKAFKDWFGDWENNPKNASKVVDENGEPLVVYHRTPNKFSVFDVNKIGSTTDSGQYGKGFYFGIKPDRAEGNYIIKAFLNIKNPYYITKDSHSSVLAYIFNRNEQEYPDWAKNRFNKNEIQELNNKDGVIDLTDDNEAVVKNPNQIKSATDNNGMFSTENDDIDYNTLSTDDIKKEIHDYVNSLPEGAVKSKEALHSFINGLTESDIKNIYNEIEQNRNDVNLVVDKLRQLARDKKPKGNQKYFTFKDGKSVKAPFIPNDQQTEALDKIDDFLKSNKKVMTLSGYAGTGKTSIMEMIAEKAKIDGMQIVFTATTNKATQVLKAKVGYIGYPVMTANKAFGIALEPGDKQEYDADDLKAVLVESKVAGSDAAIIDEASMISQENFDILTSIAKETGLKIIFVGDVAQLPPVERDNDSVKLSPVFTNKQGDVITLTKVERTGDNAILKEATNLRDGEELSGVSSFNKDGKGVAYMKPSSQEERDKIIKTFAPKMREDPDYFRILTYSNKSVAQYNDTVRRLLGYNDNTPRVGETILGYANYDYNKQTRQYGFINSGSYKVVSVAPSKVKKIHIEGEIVSLDVVPVTIEGIDGGTHTYDMVDIKGNDANKKAVTKIAKTLSNLWAQWKSTPAISQKRIILEAINGLEKSLFVNDNIFNERGYKLLNKRYDFGYAMTIHKSQGSTFKNVLLDDVNIAMYNNYLDREALKNAESKVHHSVDASSVDITNNGIAAAHSNMDNAEIESSTDFDLFGDDNTQGAASSQTNTTQDNTSDMVDIRRQLEYVGVSRASDTVTIISNDVKKEGSPLSPKDTPTEPDTTDTIKNYTIPNHYTGMITPDANTIFVFGSNPEGRHGAGAAKTAVEKFGAKYKQGEGLQGNAYALPTKDISTRDDISDIKRNSDGSIEFNAKTPYGQFTSKYVGNTLYIKNDKGDFVQSDTFGVYSLDNNDILGYVNRKLNKDLRSISPAQITENIKKMYEVARQHPDKQFKIAYTNGLNQATLNGYTGREMIKMFKDAGPIPSNVVFNKEWTDHWNEVTTDKDNNTQDNSLNNKDIGSNTLNSVNNTYINHSGGAYGSDFYWGNIGEKYGVESKHYYGEGNKTPFGNTPVSKSAMKEADSHLEKANKTLNRRFPTSNEYVNNLLRRNWQQVKNSDAIFAVSTIADNNTVNGGTGWAVQMAIDNNKPVHVFDQDKGKWYEYNYSTKSWDETDTPTLTKNFAGIGSRKIDDTGKKAIEEVYKKTFENNASLTDKDNNPNTINPVQKVLSDKKVDMQKTLSLPNFEHFVYNRAAKDLKGIEIDYPWKESYLKELDSQFRRMEDEDDEVYHMSNEGKQYNQKLIDKMKVILNAKDKDDYLDEKQRKEKEEEQAAKSDFHRLNQQYANLLNGMTGEDLKYVSSPLKVSEIRDIAELTMDYISDTISDIQAKEGLAKQLFPNVKPKEGFDFTKATREEIIGTIGIENLLNHVKKVFDPEQNDWFDNVDDFIDATTKADFIRNNWDAIVKIGSDIFTFNEGIGISRDYGNHRFSTTKENLQLDINNFNDFNDEDSLNETEGDAQEHWQVDFRTIDAMMSMSALVRKAIHECYKLDENGEPVVNPLFGIKERIDPRQVTNSILRWTQGSLTLEDMIQKLNEKKVDNPWLEQLINRLQDKSNPVNIDLQSQFFGVFSKHFQLYSIVLDQNGKFTCINANAHPALTEVMDSIVAKYNIGEHPLFQTSGLINRTALDTLHQAENNLPEWNFRGMKKEVDMSPDKMNEYAEWLSKVSSVLGFDATPDMVASVLNKDTLSTMVEKLHYLVENLDNVISKSEEYQEKYNPFEFKGSNAIKGEIQSFIKPITEILEDTAINAFYNSGKMYQSYVIPSFTTKLFQKFTKSTNEKFKEFMEEEYGKSQWFGKKEWSRQYGEIMHWNVPWLKYMGSYRSILDHRVQLSFNGHNYMKNLTDPEYALSVLSEYFSVETENGLAVAWFRIPMESNKPSEEFIKFRAYREDLYKKSIVDDLSDMVFMEISRIQTVMRRNLSKGDKGFIKNFDTNGRQFCFFPFLNDYIEKGGNRTILKDAEGNVSDDNEVLAELLQKKIKGEEELTPEDEIKLKDLIEKATTAYMQNRANNILEMMDKKGIIQAAQKVKNIIDPDFLSTKDDNGNELEGDALDKHNEFVNGKIKDAIENFIWNDYLASKNILMMLVGDTAFYKDAEDLQKRLAELHAPGIRANVHATDYGDPKKGIEPKRVSDGKYRTLILKDFDDFKSNIIANLTEVFDRKIAQAKPYEKAGMMALKEDVIRAYSEINVADAEGYSCMTSYRKKALMFGKWGLNAEEIYKKILNGTYTYTDLKTAFQPMKPFVYTHLLKNMNAAKAPITQMYCPFQAKNSEVLLVMADALLRNEETSRPNLLRAISNIMEDSAYDGRERDTTGKIIKQGTYNGKGIDTVQFESAIKSSLQTPLDLNQFIDDKENGEVRAYTYLKSRIYKEGTNDYDTDNYVQEAPFEDYAIQQEIPEHFKDHSQAHGSQIRMIIPSDLDYYYDVEKGREHPEDESNIVKYEWTDDKGKKHSLNANEFRHHYESTIAENILDSLDKLAREFHLQDSNGDTIEDKKERNMALSQILVKEIDSSPRYGVDLRWACSLNDDGEFNIPLGDPIQCKRIEQLINSIIKNRVNKQEIAGGPIVQVSNYGASKQLHIRFNDKNGNLMPSEEEFNKAKEEGTLTDEQKKYSSYQDYAKENQGGIAYFEVFAPIWSDEIAEKFMDKDGNIDMKAIEETNPEMLKLITYRIPTEDKYSMAPCKIVGFMPRQAGETIMLPYELTSIDGSDFDIDKRYVMRKDYKIIVSKKKVEKELHKRAEAFIAAKKNAALTYNDKTTLNNKISVFLDTIDRSDADKLLSGNLDKELKRLYQEILDDKEVMKHCYTTAEVSKNSKQFNDNEIVNMSWAVLTNPTSADKILNPGGFELQKKVGYMVAAYKNPANADVSWDKLHALETGDLKKLSYTQKDLAWFDTQMQFYKQNSAAATLIGIFAVNKIAHAVLEADDFYIDIDEICGTGFNIGKIGNKDGEYKGLNFAGRMKVDPRYDSKGNIIGKVLGSLVGASADAVKDPVLNLMNINITTAGMLNTMIRLGLPFEDAALFLSQDIVTRVIDEFNKRNLSGYASIDDVVNDFLDDIAAEEHINENSNINYEAISKQELIDGLREGDHKASDYKVLLVFSKLKAITDRMRNITFATRFNSISSAVGPLIVDNLIMEHKIGNFLSKENANLDYIKPKERTKNNEPAHTAFYDKKGNVVDINDVWAAHPILDSFKSTVGIAHKIFDAANMPTNSTKFRTILATLDNYGLTEKVFSDKKLLDQLSTFYQSYMLMASELIDSENLSYYINEFPKKFLKYQQDPKYKDNALIQAIKLNFSRKTKKPFLQIKITGMDAKQKEELGSAWVDLYKENQNLSNALFQYSFFRAGIGFSPKTFMALIPVYVKNHLSKTVDGEKITYNDVYKGMYNDRIVNDNVIDQFVRNNWDNNKLVSWANVKKDGLSVNLRTKTLTVYTEDGYNSLMGKMFIKTSAYGNTYLWKKRNNIWSKKETWIYDMISPLGNNGEYLEISTNEISKALADTKEVKAKDNQADSDIRDHNAIDDEASSTHNPTTPDSVVKQNAASLKDMFINSNSRLADKDSISGKTRAENLIEAYKKPGAAEKNVGILQKIFKANGLNLNEEETIKKFREMC